MKEIEAEVKAYERWIEYIRELTKMPKKIEIPIPWDELRENPSLAFEFFQKLYSKAGELSAKHLRTQEEIQKFLENICKKGYGKRRCTGYVGIYVSYLVNEVYSGRKIELNLKRLPRLHFLGMYNTRKIWVLKGNVGNCVGCYMRGGKITVIGNANSYVGYHMENGEIVIVGDADWYLGMLMRGGKIKVRGDAGSRVGINMEDGVIEVEGIVKGDAGTSMRGGKIIAEDIRGWVGKGMTGGAIIIRRRKLVFTY